MSYSRLQLHFKHQLVPDEHLVSDLVKVASFGHVPHRCIAALGNSKGFLIQSGLCQLRPVSTCLRGQLHGLESGKCAQQVLQQQGQCARPE